MTANFEKFLKYLTPLILAPAILFDLLRPSVTAITITLEICLLILGAWYPYAKFPNVNSIPPKYGTKRKNTIIQSSEWLALIASVLLVLLSSDNSLPILFFPTLALFYGLLFCEAYYFNPTMSIFMIKLAIAQVILVEAFALPFVTVESTDSLRDFYIGSLIIHNGGGLPQRFTDTIWYDFSPFAAIIYAIGSLITSISLLRMQIISGYVFAFASLLAVGSIATKVFRNRKLSLISMWISGLVPFFWEFSTFPIPEMIALVMVLLIFSLIVGNRTIATMVTTSILAVAIVLVHGGIAIELIVVTLFVFLLTKNRVAGRIAMITTIMLIVYSVWVSVSNTIPGALAIAQFAQSLFIPVSQITPARIIPTTPIEFLVTVGQSLTESYWWVFLGFLAWVGFLDFFRGHNPFRDSYMVLTVVSLVLFAAGVAILIEPVAQGQATRYLSLVAYAVLCVPASSAIIRIVSRGRSFLLLLLVILFVATSVSNAWISPSLWQDIGQNQNAGFRLVHSVTTPELGSQLYLNSYDRCFPIASNYLPEFINLTASCSSLLNYRILSETYYNGIGVADYGGYLSLNDKSANYVPLSQPYLVLASTRIASFSPAYYGFANPQANISAQRSDIVYSDLNSWIAFV